METEKFDCETIEGIGLWVFLWIDGKTIVKKTEQMGVSFMDFNEKVVGMKCWLRQVVGRIVRESMG